jgi:hypothetical protein
VTSSLHQAFVEFFRVEPALVPELLERVLGLELPRHQELRIDAAALGEVVPVTSAADLVVELVRDGKVVLGIVLEVQLARDPDKCWSWPFYLVSLRFRLRRPCWLLVVAPEPAMARWCARPIELGQPGFALTPLVLGPSAVPVVASEEQVRAAPALAVLSAMAHGRGAKGGALAFKVLCGLMGDGQLDDDHVRVYNDLVMASLDEAARRALEELMNTSGYQYQSEFARKHYALGEAKGKAEGKAEGEAKGKAEGKAEAILAVLQARGIAVPSEAEARVRACVDATQLDEWLRRAAVGKAVEEILG